MNKPKFIPLPDFRKIQPEDLIHRSSSFYEMMKKRRTVREFSNKSVPKQVIINCIKTAATAPNGANKQPWHFVVISDPEVKKKIREEAEKEEWEFYHHRAPEEWLTDLEVLGTDEHKPFLEEAPYLITIFSENYGIREDGSTEKHYYVKESVGIATGMLITAIHQAGLVSLTHTPSPMNFLNEILHRPKNEKPFLLLVVGYPAVDAHVPDITKKPLDKIITFF
ncbi:MAG TPA: nitroreductase family protein [Balneolales bacterium]|nr:nitroreductase family protein [Balneolales bacterium]